jgi:L-ascorbate metabolism protein UlaG (beta-lactamase superfamily)
VPTSAAQITRFTHSCVRIERAGRALVIDPGIWSEPLALLDADAVLVTHEHSDHIDELRLADLGVPVFAPVGANIDVVPFTEVRAGETFTAAGFQVTAVGGLHATVTAQQTPCPNLGFVVDDEIYHPGDALHVPDHSVRTVLVPMQASWLKTSEAMAFLQAVDHEQAYGIHDGQINGRAISSINGWLTKAAPDSYRWLPPGAIAS